MLKIDNFRGFFGIGIYQPKHEENIGTLWRHAYLYNASFVFTIGRKYRNQSSDTSRSYNHVPLYYYEDFEDFDSSIPEGCEKVAIELHSSSVMLSDFAHPLRSVYILGSEGHGLPEEFIERVNQVVQIYSPKPQSMNVSVSGTLVMYDRVIKQLT